ncbi:MAG: methionine synthase, partial [Candidatus Desantisbacteria bacterium]
MNFHANYLATAIGSFPHQDPNAACRIILENLPEIPVCPQLPRLGFLENMYVQYSEGLPCVNVDIENKKIFFDTSKDMDTELERFYEKYLSNNISTFEISKKYSAGFYAMMEILKKEVSPSVRFIKGQITGPISFGLT